MISSRLFGLGLAAALVGLAALRPASAQSYTAITDFAKNGNIQKNLQASFPSGAFTANNSFNTPFQITSDTNGNNFDAFGSGNALTINNIGLFGVSDVYTLINAYGPNNGSQIASVEFLGSGGADQTFSLFAGTQVRDFYQGGYANSINGTTTQNAYSVVGPGAAGTGDVNTGAYGTYVVDEQDFHLDPSFTTQTLNSIKITAMNGSPIVLGVTAAAPVPEASTTASLALLLALSLGGMILNARKKMVAKRAA